MTWSSRICLRGASVALCLLLLVGLGLPFAVQAQAQGTQGSHFLYRVQPGDTLSELALRYTGKVENWHMLQTLNAVDDPWRMPPGLNLRIPLALIPVRTGQMSLIHVSGTAWVNDQPAMAGQVIEEGAVLHTGEDGHVTLTLEDGSTLTVPNNVTITLDRLRMFDRVDLVDAVIQLRSGSLESRVAPSGEGVGRFEVRTPNGITAVRGTHLRIHVDGQGSSTEVLHGAVQVTSPGDIGGVSVHADQGVRVAADGQISRVQPLLMPPVLHPVQRRGAVWHIPFDAVAGATRYRVAVATDAQGTRLYASHTINTSPARVRSYDEGTHYVLVRAIDANTLGGGDAVTSFAPPATAVLTTTDGTPVLSSSDLPVTLPYR